ncbi:RES family NAD+ phosphorylase [Paenibacillus riograndensis]|uniref:RES domain-containing protein n=2 Tax=Paenibacillus riograndensis TaxID=483937 RepID=A0A0E4H812_9BACL|nr:RES family NAD+ phosphorylase [Paenibacillus riograndensis]CQR52424.1 hypothetical protein PRIO_0820 [Paenibacillus riograndensis SBR5]
MENVLRKLGDELYGKREDSFEYLFYKKEFSRMLESDLKEYNPEKIIDKYLDFFSRKNFSRKILKEGEGFFRGRIGSFLISGSKGTYNTKFELPYYGNMIETPPPIYTAGGRFNRAGISYLYLATDLETCLAEVHLQVGQACSIGEFECVEDMELINLSDYGNDLEIKIWYEVLTQPVHNEIRYKYLITQFMSDVLMKFNENGLYFKSVQSTGDNIVCYYPEKFRLIQFSEKLYKANKIKYDFEQIKDTVREYVDRKDHYLNISDLNTDETEENEKHVNYLLEWIDKEKERNNKN